MITAKQYLMETARTCKNYPLGLQVSEKDANFLHAVLGIAGEAGELVDAFKKHLIYEKPFDTVNAKEELGDILWYMALACRVLSVTFEQLMEENIAKLRKRYPTEYTDADAAARADKD